MNWLFKITEAIKRKVNFSIHNLIFILSSFWQLLKLTDGAKSSISFDYRKKNENTLGDSGNVFSWP